MKRRLLLTVFLSVGLVGAVIATLWLIVAIAFDPNGRRPLNIILAFDRLFNASVGGEIVETLSSRAGRLQNENVPWACYLCKFLNFLEKDHCQDSIGV